MTRPFLLLLPFLPFLLATSVLHAEPPSAKYIFPAGGRRGTTVPVRIGGCNFHGRAHFHLMGSGIKAATEIAKTNTQWFEGPLIPLPASQASEDYPVDHANSMEIATDAPLGDHLWKVSTSQGVTASLPFVVGDLPEIVERELPGVPAPVSVNLPVTVNGRIFPREDVDQWQFHLTAGQTVTCSVDALRLKSPLEARLELFDPHGHSLGESLSQRGNEALLRFTATEEGDYSVKIHDIQFGGLQDYVYRLTLTAGPRIDDVFPLGGQRGTDVVLTLSGANLPAPTATVKLPTGPESQFAYRVEAGAAPSNAIMLDLGDLPEVVESASRSAAVRVTLPAVLNGRVQQPGEADDWSFEAKKGDRLDFDVRAARLGSPLDSVLQILDAQLKVIAENDDLNNGQTDSLLRWTSPADGVYTARVTDRLPDRGSSRFAYRLRVTGAANLDWYLNMPSDALVLERKKPATLKVFVDRGATLAGDIALGFEGLPAGITVSPQVIPAQQNEVTLTFVAADSQKVECLPVTITGTLKHGDQQLTQPVVLLNDSSRKPAQLWLAVALPTPFRFAGLFETKYMSRGSHFTRHYTIQRNGFEGPLEARLADAQGRHLQGASGDPVSISPTQNEFDFTVKLPPWMEIGRTSRTQLLVMGIITDTDGSRHVVSYSSNAQNDQMIALVDPGKLAITLNRRTLPLIPGEHATLDFRLQRGMGLNQDAQIEVIVPDGMSGVSSETIKLPMNDQQGQLKFAFSAAATEVPLAPLIIRATTLDDRHLPVTAEAELELVPLSKQAKR